MAGLRQAHGRPSTSSWQTKRGETNQLNKQEPAFYGLDMYKEAGYDIHAEGNVYYNGAKPYGEETQFVLSDHDPGIKIEETDDGVLLTFMADSEIKASGNRLITPQILGTTIVSECIFEQPDGTPYLLDSDYFGERRTDNPLSGPFTHRTYGNEVVRIAK